MGSVFLYSHGGSRNHGCEAIVRTTVGLLDGFGSINLISSKPEEDIEYGLDNCCRIIKETNEIKKKNLDFAKAYYSLKIKQDYIPMEKLRYKEAFSPIKKGDLALSVGGDNYCYADVEKYVMLHQVAKEKGAKTVLWGCSVDPIVIQKKEIAEDLAQYDLITARESLSYEALKRVNSNTVLVSDTAFWLPEEQTALPQNFVSNNTVGINVSPLVIGDEASKGIVKENYSGLIETILQKTDMHIALIPHVVWEDNDDRIPLSELFEQYKNNSRICLIEDRNCMQLKYIISRCRFFVGARTHATIAAYSSLVPTLVLGYSIKSKGIAKDLFESESRYVIPVRYLREKSEIADSFADLIQNEGKIKDILRRKKKERESDKANIRQALLELKNE